MINHTRVITARYSWVVITLKRKVGLEVGFMSVILGLICIGASLFNLKSARMGQIEKELSLGGSGLRA